MSARSACVGWAERSRSPHKPRVRSPRCWAALRLAQPTCHERFRDAAQLGREAKANGRADRQGESKSPTSIRTPSNRTSRSRPKVAPSIPTPASVCSCGHDARALPGAPGERREAGESPEGLAAGMRPRFSTGQGWPVRKPRPSPAYPECKMHVGRGRGVPFSLVTFSWASKRK
jgi:hypothetical protein